MPRVREVAIAMAQENLLDIRQGGRTVVADGSVRGPIRLGRTNTAATEHPTTPDGRYFVVRGRLWRKANRNLPANLRDALVNQLMDARRALCSPRSEEQSREARVQVDRAKQSLEERGPDWWMDGAPDFNRKLAKNTPYVDWFLQLPHQSL